MFLDSRTEFYLPCRSNLLILTQKSGHLGLVTSLVLLHWYAVSVLAVMSCVKGCSVSWMQTFQLGLLQVNRICWFWREIFGLLFWQHMEANDLETHKTPWKAVMCILNFKLTTISKKAGRKSGVCRPENTILTWGRTDHYSVTMSNSLLLGKRFFVPSQLSSLRSDPSNMSEFSLSCCLYIVMCALIEDAGSEDDCLGFLVTTLWFSGTKHLCTLRCPSRHGHVSWFPFSCTLPIPVESWPLLQHPFGSLRSWLTTITSLELHGLRPVRRYPSTKQALGQVEGCSPLHCFDKGLQAVTIG